MKKRKIIIFSAIFIISLVLLNYETLAKFVTDKITSYYLRSKNFYFSSDLLDTNNSEYQIGTWGGVGNFSITFNLYAKDNELLFSESDIAFEVSATTDDDVTLSYNKQSGTIYANNNEHSDTIIITVAPQKVFLADERVTIQVVARSTSPYEKTIRAKFIYIVSREGVSYEIEDEVGRAYMFLKVINDVDYCTVKQAFGNYSVNDHIPDSVYRQLTASEKAKCISQNISLSFNPQNYLIDNTSSIMSSATYTLQPLNGINYINSLNFAIAPNSTVAIKFYKINPNLNNTYPSSNNPSSAITVNSSNP